jgi:hypothetical protein
METNKKVLKEHAYLYSCWSGHLIVYEGIVYEGHSGSNQTGQFKTKTKRFLCAYEPEVVHNSVVWLGGRNDDLAKKILTEYEEKSIKELQDKIKNHQSKIEMLKWKVETENTENRDRSLTFEFVGPKEDLDKMLKEVKRTVKEIVPKARLTIEHKKGEK